MHCTSGILREKHFKGLYRLFIFTSLLIIQSLQFNNTYDFSYEPNFLFNDEDDDDDIEFVCDCCDPKRKKKKPSSEECSEEEEASEKDLSEDDEDKNEDEIIDALDEDSDDSRDMTSREDSPAIDTPPTTPATSFPAKSSKPLPPGWFGKGRSKKRRKQEIFYS